ncbi:MAG: L-seryl-tRNA(Sec) selenium transferase [Acidobacteria bacterium]|nr:MAG: L-seryl-tRNA(Sec) selenium transferase [Acidobacteriota bacterium]
MNKNEAFRKIPKMDNLLNWPEAKALQAKFGHSLVKEAMTVALGRLRSEIQQGSPSGNTRSFLIDSTVETLQKQMEPSLKRVVNGTGIIIHTNLGRAILPQPVLEHLAEIGSHYNCLEYDLKKGSRGHRDFHAERLMAKFFGVESACVVNNNAAAVMLMINTFAAGREVVVSRGELIEIGGSFRIPEIMKKAGARLVEVGTTNKTHLQDYESAIGPDTGLVLKVHPSNYRISGFTESVGASQLAAACARHQIPFAEDMGSGNLYDLSVLGIQDEPRVSDSVKSGINLISFSGDKLFGGVQAGIIIGEKELVDKIRNNHLLRALRVDKLVYAALEQQLILYLTERMDEIPTWQMLFEPMEDVAKRAAEFRESLAEPAKNACELIESLAKIGGGTTPEQGIPSVALTFSHSGLSPDQLSERFRKIAPPVIGRIHENRFLLDFRTILKDDLEILRDHVNRLFEL